MISVTFTLINTGSHTSMNLECIRLANTLDSNPGFCVWLKLRRTDCVAGPFDQLNRSISEVFLMEELTAEFLGTSGPSRMSYYITSKLVFNWMQQWLLHLPRKKENWGSDKVLWCHSSPVSKVTGNWKGCWNSVPGWHFVYYCMQHNRVHI